MDSRSTESPKRPNTETPADRYLFHYSIAVSQLVLFSPIMGRLCSTVIYGVWVIYFARRNRERAWISDPSALTS